MKTKHLYFFKECSKSSDQCWVGEHQLASAVVYSALSVRVSAGTALVPGHLTESSSLATKSKQQHRFRHEPG